MLSSAPAAPLSPDPQLDEHQAVVGEFCPHGCVGLAVGDLAKGAAIHLRQDPPVDDEVIDELREHVVAAAHGHLLRERGEIGVRGLAIIQVGPDVVIRLMESAVKVPQHNERRRSLSCRVDPAFQDGHLRQQCLTGGAGRGVLETAALEMDRHELDRLPVMGEIDQGAIAQAPIAPDIQRLEVRLANHREPALQGKTGVLLPVQRPFGAAVDVHVVDIDPPPD